MSVRRQSTVHDLASLRLHPDGSRVQNLSRAEKEGRPSAASTRLAKYTTRDAQGRWIAYDAGGLGTVKQRIRKHDAQTRQTRSSDAERDGNGDESPFAELSQMSRWKETFADAENRMNEENMEDLPGYVKDSRARKRTKFYHDYSFLDDPRALELRISAADTTLLGDESPSSGFSFPVPSSVRAIDSILFLSHLQA